MHDPLRVAFEVRRPWPKPRPRRVDGSLARTVRYWPPMVTVWHREPRGHDSGEVCKHYRIEGDQVRLLSGWRLHVHHWRIQVHALQELRRRLLTRCAWCGGTHSKADPVNNSHSWDGPAGRWRQGEPGLYHSDCSSVVTAYHWCLCDQPALKDGKYGQCARCGNSRPFGWTPLQLERMRLLATIPPGRRDAEVYERFCELGRCAAVAR